MHLDSGIIWPITAGWHKYAEQIHNKLLDVNHEVRVSALEKLQTVI